jgi:hypothetical protein
MQYKNHEIEKGRSSTALLNSAPGKTATSGRFVYSRVLK